tara:strand:+ start:3776 stop:4441 length:666 start_codon:yes stop_codon:yes gene_type:complete
MRVLIVEDNMALADGVSRAFSKMGLAVDALSDGEEADQVLAIQDYDLLVLDLNLPGCDGLEVLRRLRQRGDKVQVIILTARDQLLDRVAGLDLGADDYLTKPFELSELEARVRALLRRQSDQANPVIQHGRLRFDTVARRVWVDEDSLELPRRELSLLELLLNRVGQVVSKDQIADGLASFDHDITPNAVETHVSRLRKRIKSADISIRTVRGLGYLLEKP